MLKHVAAAAVTAVVLAGCSVTTDGTPQPPRVNPNSAPSGSVTVTTTAAPARVPVTIEGSSGDFLDRAAQNTLDALVTFWDGQGVVTDPITYSFWQSGSGEQSPTCGKGGHAARAAFCNSKKVGGDRLYWDKTHFGDLVNNPDVGAKIAGSMVLGHEYGHAVQAATNNYSDNDHAELQADCLAGVFAASYAPEISDERWGAAANHVYLWTPANADKVHNRTAAFSEGWYKKSAAFCNSYTG